ncbi:MucBP domain-containing protein [Carnobacterium maltaromaticum]|uniref:MucBP domain-containing protein n=1 Tax=Carnobacterium maltaromaticum TaxID=2751 RepID=UPI00295F4564|nr:MucBP domain-containing protein [Carnobacterium maltaromaticum]
MLKKLWIVTIAIIVLVNTINFTSVVSAVSSATPSSWLEVTMDYNEPFIKEIENVTKKTRSNITLTDVQAITTLYLQSPVNEIPNNIDVLSGLTSLNINLVGGTISTLPDSIANLKELKILSLSNNNFQTFPLIVLQLPKLEDLSLDNNSIKEIPDTITNISSHLKFLSMKNNQLVKVPETIFSTRWSTNNELNLMIAGNQVVTNVPANYMSQYNNGENMLEYYDNQSQKQDQLTTISGYTLNVPVGTDFNQLTPDKTNLELASGKTLFPQHEFEYYDDGSSTLIQNGVAVAPGQSKIYIKSKFSTVSNKFAKTLVSVNITALDGGPVTVTYTDASGTELAPQESISGKVGDPYTSTPKTIVGYTLTTIPPNQNGTFSLNPVSINYVYKGNDYKLTSTFKDENGKELLKPEIDKETYTINTPYKTSEAIIPGYALVSAPTNQTGTFGAGDVTVEYVYKAIDYKLTSIFKDENGKELSTPINDTKNYKINDAYTTSEASIPGYTLVSAPTNQIGTFGAGDVTVEYVYRKTEVNGNKPVSGKTSNPKTLNKENKTISSSKKVMPSTGESRSYLIVFKYLGTFLVLMCGTWLVMKKKYSK